MCISLVWALECFVQSHSWPLLMLFMLRYVLVPQMLGAFFLACLLRCPFLFLLHFFFIHHHLLHHLLSALAQIYYLLSLSLDGPTFCIDCYNNIGTVYFNLIVSILAQFFSFLGEEIFFTCKVIRKCLLNE